MELLTVSSVYSRIFSKNSQASDENRHICVYHSVSLVSHCNYCCRPRRISCPAMLVLLNGFNILQYNSKGLWKAKIKLSKHVWNLEKENRQFSIRWAIVKQVPAGRNGKRNCTLCIEEKPITMKCRSKNILNRRSKMFSQCCHF